MARLSVRSSTMEKTCRYANRCSQMWNNSHPSPLLAGCLRYSEKATDEVIKSITMKAKK